MIEVNDTNGRDLVATIYMYSEFEDWQDDVIPFWELKQKKDPFLDQFYKKADIIIDKIRRHEGIDLTK